MAKKRHWLNNKKGLEWWHIILVAVIVGFAAYGMGVGSVKTYCDTYNVEMDNVEFNPQKLTIHPCDTITWTNVENDRTHTITGEYVFEEGSQEVNSPGLMYLDSFSKTFDEIGIFNYYSEAMPQIMTGKIIVE